MRSSGNLVILARNVSAASDKSSIAYHRLIFITYHGVLHLLHCICVGINIKIKTRSTALLQHTVLYSPNVFDYLALIRVVNVNMCRPSWELNIAPYRL